MALIWGRLAPPVVLVAGSRPVGQLPEKPPSSRTVRSPPLWGGPAVASVEPPWLAEPAQPATNSSGAKTRDSSRFVLLTCVSRFVIDGGCRPASPAGGPRGRRLSPGGRLSGYAPTSFVPASRRRSAGGWST